MIEILSETGRFVPLDFFPDLKKLYYKERTKDGHYLYTIFETENITVSEIQTVLEQHSHAWYESDYTNLELKIKITLNDGER